MKIFLAFFVAMGSIVTLGDAACFTEFREPWWPEKGCMLNGNLYRFGHTQMREDCFKCDCDKDEMTCCSFGLKPPFNDEDNCKVIFDREHCRYVVVQKDDPSKFCSSGFTG